MQEEHEVDADLRHGERQHRDAYAGAVDHIRRHDPERRGGEKHRKRQAEHIAADAFADIAARFGLIARCAVAQVLDRAHMLTPTRYTRLKIATQMMSSACQKRVKHRKRY